jgi:sodium transport system permease protein
VWLGLLLIPFVTVNFLLLLPGFLAEREDLSRSRARFRVAVEVADDGPGAPAAAEVVRLLGAQLGGARLTLEPVAARAAVLAARADVGLRLNSHAKAALRGDGQLEGEVLVLAGRGRSRAALGVLAPALDEAGLRLTDRRLAELGLPASTVRPLVVDRVDLSETPRGRRLSLAALLPLLVLLPVAGSVGVSAQRISGSKDQRVFEPLLVLPLTRRELLAGKAVSAALIGSITLAAVGLPLLAGRVVPVGSGGRTVTLPLAEIVGAVGFGAVLLVLLVSLGMAVGAASRTSAELGSVLQMATLPIFLLGSLLQFRSGIVTTTPLLGLPFFGVLLCLRDLAIGGLTAPHVVTALTATAAWSSLLLAVAARLLDSERSVLRTTT